MSIAICTGCGKRTLRRCRASRRKLVQKIVEEKRDGIEVVIVDTVLLAIKRRSGLQGSLLCFVNSIRLPFNLQCLFQKGRRWFFRKVGVPF